jgi:hypothetical protein
MYYRVVSAGFSAMNGTVVNISGFSANGISPGFYSYTPTNLNGTSIANRSSNTFNRSYNVLVIGRITGATTTTTYDVYNGTGNISLINYLNSLTSSVIVVIATYEEPKNNVTPDLVTAIKRCGGSSNFPNFINSYGAYVLVGIPGNGENTGIEKYVGVPAPFGDNTAAIDLRFVVSNGEYSEENNYINNLVLWYTFDSNTESGTTIRDLMNNYNGTNYGTTFETVNKKVGSASAAFAGTNTYKPYIDVVDLPASLTDANALSFSFWFRSNNTITWGRIFDFGNGESADNIIIFFNNNNLGLSVFDRATNGNNYDIIVSVNDNVWRHVVWVMTKISNNVTWNIYVNGSLSVTKTTGVFFPNSVSRIKNFIGLSNWDVYGNPGFNGGIDDFRIYKEALTQDKVTILYNYK